MMNAAHFVLSWTRCRVHGLAALVVALAVPALATAQTPPAADSTTTPLTTAAAVVEQTGPTPPPQDTQVPAAAQPGDVPPPAPPQSPWLKLFGPTKVSTTADIYYEYNGNEPASGQNVLRNFDEKDNQFAFSYYEFAFEQVPTDTRRVGFRADIGFGPTANWVNSTDPDDGALKYLQQGYVSVLAPVGRGLQIDAGKFNTPIGAEPTETAYNWNYSRSLLFSWAAPYYHVGVRAALPVSDTVTVTGFLINGWNNAQDNNRAKTGAAQVAWKVLPSLTLSQAWMGGPEGPNGAAGWRNLYDTIATWTVNPRLSLMTNIDIGRDTVNGQTAAWQGVAGYARVTILPTWAVTPRFEVFEDRDGFATGTAQTIREITLTSEHMLFKGLSLRVEYRRDWSTEDFFEYKEDQFRPQQNTILFGLTYAIATP
jgi:hypothetical protein